MRRLFDFWTITASLFLILKSTVYKFFDNLSQKTYNAALKLQNKKQLENMEKRKGEEGKSDRLGVHNYMIGVSSVSFTYPSLFL